MTFLAKKKCLGPIYMVLTTDFIEPKAIRPIILMGVFMQANLQCQASIGPVRFRAGNVLYVFIRCDVYSNKINFQY
jgi:hypothetical protein